MTGGLQNAELTHFLTKARKTSALKFDCIYDSSSISRIKASTETELYFTFTL